MNLSCKHLKAETHKHQEVGDPIKETHFDCTRELKVLGSLKPCTYVRAGKILKSASILKKDDQSAYYVIGTSN
jgi:hypothetical protein